MELEHQLLGRVLGIDQDPGEEGVPRGDRQAPAGPVEEVLHGLAAALLPGAEVPVAHGVGPAPRALGPPAVALLGRDPRKLLGGARLRALHELRLPGGTSAAQLLGPGGRRGLGAPERRLELLETRPLVRVGDPHLGRHLAALEVAVDPHLVDVREEGRQGVEVRRRVGVELVVVALRTAQGRAEPDARVVAHAVGRVLEQELLGLRAALEGDHVQPVVAGGHALPHRRVRQQVASELLHREAIEGHVLVEGPHDPVAVGPDGPLLIAVVADRVRVPDEVEPVLGHALAVVRRGEQLVDVVLEAHGAALEPAEVLDARRESGEVPGQPPHQGAQVRRRARAQARGRELGLDEGVHVELGSRHTRRRPGPVPLPRGALLDPALEELDLVGGQLVA